MLCVSGYNLICAKRLSLALVSSCGYIWSSKHLYAVRSVKARLCISNEPLIAIAYGTWSWVTVVYRNTDYDTFSMIPIRILSGSFCLLNANVT